MDLLVFFNAGKYKIREFASARAQDGNTMLTLKHHDQEIELKIPLESFKSLRQQRLKTSQILNIGHKDTKEYIERVHRAFVTNDSSEQYEAYPNPISVQFNEKVINNPTRIPPLVQSREIIVDSYVMRNADENGHVQYGGRFFDESGHILRSAQWNGGTIFHLADSFHEKLLNGQDFDLTQGHGVAKDEANTAQNLDPAV